MQPRLNIALKACRSAAEIINNIYKSKNQDDLRSYDGLDQILYKHIIGSIGESYPFNKNDSLGPTNIDISTIKDDLNDISYKSDVNDGNEYIWVINPIDSYDNFVNKIPLFNITIAIFLNGVVQASLVYNPVLDQLVTAIKGEGAIFENKKIRNTNTVNDKILYVINDKNIKLNLKNILRGHERLFGSRSSELVFMAEGKLDLVIYPQIDVWDYAAGVLICKESGVLVTGIRGEEEIHNCKSILAAREILHKEILLKLD
tara:strand:+ start:354 stop:1130 length:777 start_codon:yes stop_codon:yes gene_type:complete